MHKNEQICQKCAINCGIEGNASNENITKYKNLCGVKSISNSVQGLVRYRIVALISIGRLCIFTYSAVQNVHSCIPRFQTKYSINQLESSSRNSSRNTFFGEVHIIHFSQLFYWTSYFDELKGVRLGIFKSRILYKYIVRWVKMKRMVV